MSIGWRYYNHALIPICAPHENANTKVLDDDKIWKQWNGVPLLARWTSDWDCGKQTEWWYCIADQALDLSTLKAKRRYEINKGLRNYEIKKINPCCFKEDLFKITKQAYSGWPVKYRPYVEKKEFLHQVDSWGKYDVLAGFSMKSGDMKGYAVLIDHSSYVEFSILRTDPEEEKYAINAAMVAGIFRFFENRFDGYFYISDGTRSVRHETAFQDYLEKYFGFRKSYCHLHVRYRKGIKFFVDIMFAFRKLFKIICVGNNNVIGLLKLEEIRRSF